MDALLLSRLQFALTIAFHYVFPPLSIGLGLILVIMEITWLRTGKPVYLQMTKFWVKIFALIFSIGVASGIVMEFQFGTNWAAYSRYVGDVFGSALAAEGIFAFFLESGFLALLIFGWNKVSKGWHFFATLMVAFGSMFSAIWIVVADSWMQTPGTEGVAYHTVMHQGQLRAEVVNFWAVVFNPSAMDRLWHVLMGAWQAGAWLVLSVSAFYLLKKRHTEFAKASMKVALCVALAASLLQLASGHKQGIVVAKNQPAKMAAYEGHWDSAKPADLYLFGWYRAPASGAEGRDGPAGRVTGVGIPGMLSWLIYGDTSKPVPGLAEFGSDIPPVQPVFQTYHAMVAIGMLMILLSLLGVFGWMRGTLWEKRGLLWLMVFAVILPQAANQLGWFSAEVGRQPWIVYNVMRTADAVSPIAKAETVLISLILFAVIYGLLFALFIYLLDHKIKAGPEEELKGTPVVPGPPLLQGDRAGT